jgi:hypothetical protein
MKKTLTLLSILIPNILLLSSCSNLDAYKSIVNTDKLALKCNQNYKTNEKLIISGEEKSNEAKESTEDTVYFINFLDKKVSSVDGLTMEAYKDDISSPLPADRITKMNNVSITPKSIHFRSGDDKDKMDYQIDRQTLKITILVSSGYSSKTDENYYAIDGKGEGICEKTTYPEYDDKKNKI